MKITAISAGSRIVMPAIQDSPLPMDAVIAVGFGSSRVTRDGAVVYDEQEVEDDGYWTCADAEKAAKADPLHDWRISYFAPLHEEVFQRHGDGRWMMIEKGKGFA